MAQIISAIYENGVLKPLEAVNLKEHSKVYLTIEVEEEHRKKVEEILALIRKSREGLSEEELSIIESRNRIEGQPKKNATAEDLLRFSGAWKGSKEEIKDIIKYIEESRTEAEF